MSTTELLQARRTAIAGREGEVCKLIHHALASYHVPVDEHEDRFQDVWLTILNRATPWDPSRARLSTWVHLVTLTTLQSIRGKATKAKRRAILVRDSDYPDDERGILSRLHDGRPLGDEQLGAEQARAVVSDVLREMGRRPGSAAWVLERYHLDGLTHEEIAEQLVRETGRRRQMAAHRLGWHAHELDDLVPWRRVTRTRIQQIREQGEAEFLQRLSRSMFPRPAAELAA